MPTTFRAVFLTTFILIVYAPRFQYWPVIAAFPAMNLNIVENQLVRLKVVLAQPQLFDFLFQVFIKLGQFRIVNHLRTGIAEVNHIVV